MRLAKLIPNRNIPFQQNLRTTTLRDFSGGWNVLDDDMNLSYKFATTLSNCYVDSDGRIRLRQGTRLFAACSSFFSTTASIIDMYYFSDALVVVGSNGEILKVLGDGTISRIWDATIAAALSGAPSAWGTTDFVSFEVFNGHLIVCNGSDKPLDIDRNFFVEYLQDAATGSNLNVPTCRYVVAVGRYLVMAGDPLEPDRIHISAKDAAGTWYGDPPPNDATRLDVGSIISGTTTIRGLFAHRGTCIVMFAEGLIFGELGAYDASGNHTPNFDDGVEGYGSISHRVAITHGDDALFMDLEGVPSLKRTVLSTSLKPERISELIDPEIRKMLEPLSFETLENRVFSVYNKQDGQFLLFVPNGDTVETTTETSVFVYNYRPVLKHENWAKFEGWNFTCGARSLSGRIFFGDADANIWLYGDRQDQIDTDYTVGTVGVGIEFVWELPWADFGDRTRVKHSKHISFDTRGASEFTVQMFVDNFVDTPALEMRFSGGEQGNFGSGPQPYGGGRNTSRKKHYAWPTKFEIAKLRFSGTANAQLSFVSVSLHYLVGGINR